MRRGSHNSLSHKCHTKFLLSLNMASSVLLHTQHVIVASWSFPLKAFHFGLWKGWVREEKDLFSSSAGWLTILTDIKPFSDDTMDLERSYWSKIFTTKQKYGNSKRSIWKVDQTTPSLNWSDVGAMYGNTAKKSTWVPDSKIIISAIMEEKTSAQWRRTQVHVTKLLVGRPYPDTAFDNYHLIHNYY